MPSRYKPHHYAEIFPRMDEAAFIAFKADIAEHGQIVPILLYQDKILDGRTRADACLALGIEPRYAPAEAKDDAAALELVMSLNHFRRHLTLQQAAFAAARYANIKEGKRMGERAMTEAEKKVRQRQMSPKGSIDLVGDKSVSVTVNEAAKLFKVSPSSVKRARRIIHHDQKTKGNLEKKVINNEVSLKAVIDGFAAKEHSKAVKKPSAPVNVNAQRSAASKGNRVLKRADVDPDFVGSDADFIAKYGLVWSHTANELASDKFSALALELYRVTTDLKKVFKGQRGDLDKLIKVPHRGDVERLREALDYLLPLLAEAESWLQAARQLRASPVRPPQEANGQGRAVLE